MVTKAKSKSKSKEKKDNGDLLSDLNQAQKNAVTFGAGPLLIIAGAGTGKTTVITRRIAHLIAHGGPKGEPVKPDEILALTFTDKAAGEMEERVDILLPYGYYDLWVSTFHSFCERILKQHALDIGISNDFKLLDQTAQWLLIRQNLDLFDLDYYRPLGNPAKFISALIKHFSKLKDEEISPEEYLAYAQKVKLDTDNPEFDTETEVQRIKEVANAYHVYQKLLLDNNALDFGDLINYTLRLFRARPRVLQHYRDKFKYILVDEFQDTNFAQYELVKLLAQPRNNVNVVGDDDQSIYKFRGASVSNIMQFKKDFKNVQEVTLVENYRSTQNILDTAYDFIQLNNPERLEAKLNINKKLIAASKDTGNIEVLSGQTASDEVDLVTKKIVELRKQKDVTWNDFAILVRANDQADAFISKLSALGVPYTYFANKGLYKKPIIVDILAYLRTLLNFHDSAALYKVLNLEPFKIKHEDLVNIMHYAHKKTLSVYEALQQVSAQQALLIPGITKESVQNIQKLLALLSRHGQMVSEKTIVEVFIEVIRDLQIAKRIDEDSSENLENRELLEQFYKKIEAFETENFADKSTKNFLDYLAFEQEAGDEGKISFDPNQGPESVKLLTIHSAKGLEFKYVFIVNMVHLRFPSTERKEAIEIPKDLVKEILPEGDVHLQEERRLFYVAITRAKRGVFFSYASDYGGKTVRKPSQFLVDIGLAKKAETSTEVLSRTKFVSSKVDPNLFLPTTFSYTQISEFKRCPMRYKYRHLLHLPLPGSAELSFGNTIHITLEKFLNQYRLGLENSQMDLFAGEVKDAAKEKIKLPPLSELEKLYESSWIDEWYTDKTQKKNYRDRGLKLIKYFYEDFKKNPIHPKYIEKSFRLNLGEFFFTGKLDRADVLADKSLHIIDYKTGKSKIKTDTEGRRQLLIYQWAAQEFLKEKVSSLTYWFLLDDTKSEPFVGTEQEIDILKEYLLETINEIRSAVANNNFKELDNKVPHECEFKDLD